MHLLADGYFLKLLLLPVLFVLLAMAWFTLTLAGVAGLATSFSKDRRSWGIALCGLASLLASFLCPVLLPILGCDAGPWQWVAAGNLLLGAACLVRFVLALRRHSSPPKA